MPFVIGFMAGVVVTLLGGLPVVWTIRRDIRDALAAVREAQAALDEC